MRKLICVVLALTASPAVAGLTRHDVLVIANSSSAYSQAVANYYKTVRGIPASRVKLITCSTADSVLPAEFESIREQIKTHLFSLGTVPGDPANDPTKVIILATDVPHYVYDSAERYSAVDSVLAAMFCDSQWGKEPMGINGFPVPTPGGLNPYSGYYAPSQSFDDYRAAGMSSIYYEAFPEPGFTLVRMLDANTAFAAGGNGALFRGVRSGGQWTWGAVPAKDKAWVAWPVGGVSVLDSNRAYACTGNMIKPHGGGTIIATSDSGLTWARIRRSSYSGKPKDALRGVDFVDSSRGWAVGSAQVPGSMPTPLMIRTVNGGASWQDMSASLPPSFFPRAVTAADAGNVWICGASGRIYRSADGGGTWSVANTGAPNVTYNAIWIRFSGGSYKGWAAGANGTIVRTEDGINWTVEAAGLTYSNVTDFAAFDQDHACAAFGETSVLVFDRSTGWRLENVGLAPVGSAACSTEGSVVAVGGTRYIFSNAGGQWGASCSVLDTPWRLRYLVMRLEGYHDDVSPADGIPGAIKAIIDRALAATSPGRFVLDEETRIAPGGFEYAYNALVPIVGESNVVYDTTSTYLMHQDDVIGYTSWGMHDDGAKYVTAWGRPLHNWLPGGIGATFQSSDGRGFDLPYYIYNFAPGGTPAANMLRIAGFPNTTPFDHFRAVLHAADGTTLASAEFRSGTAQIDLTSVSWPADHRTYVQIYYPTNDALHPGKMIYTARYPASSASTEVYDARAAGFAISMTTQICLMSELLFEGATGAIANVAEPWSSYCGQPELLFPAYATGFTWGETAYMGLPGIGWQEVALGDPLMAPFATPPQIAITAPAPDGRTVSGTIQVQASAAAVDAPGIAKVEFWLDDDTLLVADHTAPYQTTLDTVARGLADGVHTVEAIAFESDEVANTNSALRKVVVNNSHTPCASINNARALPDGSLVALERKVVSAVYSGEFYILEDTRIQGIRVKSAVDAAEGRRVTVLGKIQTVNGERQILADAVYVWAQ